MGEAADRLSGVPAGTESWTTEVRRDTDARAEEEPEQIERGIEQTRAEMSETIDAIQERLDPGRIKEEAVTAVKDATIGRAQHMVSHAGESAKQTSSSMLDTVRQNPLPAALAGIGLAWLWKNRSSSQTQPYYYSPEGSRASTHYASGGRYGYQSGYSDWERRAVEGDTPVRERVGEVADRAQETAGQAVERVQHAGSEAVDQVQEIGYQARERAASMGGQAQMQLDHLRWRTQQMMDESPLAMGVVAAGLGLVVGMLIPETEKENQLMGDTRDQLVDRAQEMARQTAEKVQHVAQDVTQTAKESARDEGLATNS